MIEFCKGLMTKYVIQPTGLYSGHQIEDLAQLKFPIAFKITFFACDSNDRT